jgi:hypothetical protein
MVAQSGVLCLTMWRVSVHVVDFFVLNKVFIHVHYFRKVCVWRGKKSCHNFCNKYPMSTVPCEDLYSD